VAHYAYLDANDVVTQVIVGKDEGEDGVDWEAYYGAKRTSYNTHGGVHANGGTPFRYNYAGIGFKFSDAPEWAAQGGAFIPPQPYPSWSLNLDTALWDAPTPMPAEGGPWVWDENALSWVSMSAPPE
jgi:hypothetical protein